MYNGGENIQRRWLCITLVTATMVLTLGVGKYVFAHKSITIYDGYKKLTINTTKETVVDVLEENGIIIQMPDEVSPDLNSNVKDGEMILIRRGFYVTVKAGTDERGVKTNVTTVRDLLDNIGVIYDNDDKITPELDELIQGPTEIAVTRVEKKVFTKELPVSFKIEYRYDNSLKAGEQHLISDGKYGVLKRITTVIFENGKEVSKDVAEELIKRPEQKIMAIGRNLAVSRDTRPERFGKEMTMLATAYTHTGKLTATDTKPRYGVAATDPKVIPMHSKLYIEGYGYAQAEDTGGKIKGNRIDLFFETHKEAYRFGKKSVKVYIIE